MHTQIDAAEADRDDKRHANNGKRNFERLFFNEPENKKYQHRVKRCVDHGMTAGETVARLVDQPHYVRTFPGKNIFQRNIQQEREDYR